MIELLLVGIGTGNREHLTLQAIRALNSADLILIPRKGADKADLADLRRSICTEVVTNPAARIVEFDLPRRDQSNPDYRGGVDDWHDAIADVWSNTIRSELSGSGTVAFLVWGDPTLYDSTLRIASRLNPAPSVRVIPGITSIQALTASHAIPLNEIGAPFLVTTGRRLRDAGWPAGADTLVVMLDGDCAFQHVDPADVTIWWGAYVGMPQQITLAGPLAETGPRILKARAEARENNGWIMDVYLLRRKSADGEQR
ncbi:MULTISPECIES: precorrin-6A synthase (deacetylating) [Bradyrhizobium]|uniref:Precorrin-6A synthase [deacetylating] n=2 Tax=Bradyrhizobium TaxID=374 RepID=A0ABY0PFP3_9BRAD|nr:MULTISPECIES: precorrin-6A synthase (deacetylating) [Bradyrhizobium]SDH77849.1 precorrin-6A synthase (deacetylating) [Bradyrhizobium ottawaense]SEE07332.1 precorrin-6A synthase (deacetylating) [Bradyrhizobium lablabi]